MGDGSLCNGVYFGKILQVLEICAETFKSQVFVSWGCGRNSVSNEVGYKV